MKYVMGMALGYACYQILVRENSVLKITASLSNIVSKATALIQSDDNKEYTIETRHAQPAHILTKFESFSLLLDYGVEKYESREFVAGDYKWRLVIYPDGKEKGEHISAYLELITSLPAVDSEVNAVVNIFLYNRKLDNYLCFRGNLRRFTKLKSIWGFDKLISKTIFRDPSNGYILDDTCVFGAEVFIIGNQPMVESFSPQRPVENSFSPQRQRHRHHHLIKQPKWNVLDLFNSKGDWALKIATGLCICSAGLAIFGVGRMFLPSIFKFEANRIFEETLSKLNKESHSGEVSVGDYRKCYDDYYTLDMKLLKMALYASSAGFVVLTFGT